MLAGAKLSFCSGRCANDRIKIHADSDNQSGGSPARLVVGVWTLIFLSDGGFIFFPPGEPGTLNSQEVYERIFGASAAVRESVWRVQQVSFLHSSTTAH